MLHLLSRKLNNSWSRVSVICMENRAPPVVTRVGQKLEHVLYLSMGNNFPRVATIDKQQLDIMSVSSMENQALPVNMRVKQ